MGKYLDKTGLQYFYNKLKDKFADKSTIETKLDSLTGAFTWKGELSALPTDLSGYSAGNVIKVGTKEYVCTETNGTKSWDELGDEGSYLLKTAAEDTYFKRTEGDTLIYSIGNIVNDTKNFLTPVEIKIVDSGTYTDNIQNIKDYIENLQGDKISIDTAYGYVIPVCGASSEGFLQGIAFCGDDWEQKGASLIWCYASDPKSGEGSMFYYGTIDPSTGLYKDSGKILTDLSELELKQLPTITKSKLSTDVQTSLGKADTALQSVPRATLTSDGTVRANPIKPPLKDLANSSPSYGGVKVAMGSDGVLGVGWGSKDYFGVVKIGDGLNVSNGLVSIADKSITKVKLDDSVQTSLGKADNSLQIGETNTQSKTTVVKTESTSKWESGIKVENKSDSTEITPKGITFGQAQQPIGIYHEAALKLKLDSASGSNIQLTGLATPTNDTDAVNKKYIDSGFVKICQTNEPISKHEISTTFKVNNAGYGSLQVSDVNNKTTLLNGSSILIGSMSPSGEGANLLSNREISFATATNSFGSIKVNSNNKLQITGLDTPTSDTDAANKKYVDDKTQDVLPLKRYPVNGIGSVDPDWDPVGFYNNNINFNNDDFYSIGDSFQRCWHGAYVDRYGGVDDACDEEKHYGCFALDGLDLYFHTMGTTRKYNAETDSMEDVDDDGAGGIHWDETDKHYKLVDQSTLATSLQAITIYTDNTAEHKAANLANIKAYEDNLKELGFTTTNDHNIPINIYGTTQKGFIGGNTAANRYHGIMGADNQWQMFVVAPDGIFVSSPVLGGVISQLNTTNKTSVITAINEVNTLAKSKASTSVATQSANGLMSAADKKKLDGALAAIANNASVNAIDIVSYDETTNTYSGNAIEITGNIKSEIDTTKHTYLTTGSTVDGHIESLDTALKNASSNISAATNAANTAGKDAAAAQSALNTFKNRTEGFATAAQGTKADNSVQYDTNGKDVNLPDDGTLTVFGQITSQIGKLQLGANGESSYDITITSSNIEESPAIVFSESSNDVVLTGVANPINNNDVANKQYVDSKDNSPFIIDLYSVTNYDSSKTYSTTLTKEQVEKIHTNKSFLIKFPETSNDTSTADKIVSVNGGHYVHYETLLDIYDPQHAEKNTLQRITNVCRGMNAQMTKLFTSVANVIINYDANGGVSYTLAISAVITKDLN